MAAEYKMDQDPLPLNYRPDLGLYPWAPEHGIISWIRFQDYHQNFHVEINNPSEYEIIKTAKEFDLDGEALVAHIKQAMLENGHIYGFAVDAEKFRREHPYERQIEDPHA